MKYAFSLLLLSMLLVNFQIRAQNFEVPEGFDPQKTTDYARYNKDIVSCVNWLENTPVDK